MVIFWDFDGVILDSMPVRDLGFEKVLREFPKRQVEQLLDYHNRNGGLSRYVKFRYFYEEVLGKAISDESVNALAEQFSQIMREELTKSDYIISQSVEYIQSHAAEIPMYIVSGSDQNELRFLCEKHGIDHYFHGIYGSPTPKIQLVANVLKEHGYDPAKCLLIGDSVNDFEAAQANAIGFCGFNNNALRAHSIFYIQDYSKFQEWLNRA